MVTKEIESVLKETDVGIIPSDWAVKKLSDVTNIIDSLHQTPSFVDFGYAMVRATEIKTGNLNLEKTARVDKKTYAEFTRNYRPVKGDIVLSRVGTYIGVNSFVDTDEPFCMGQNTVVIHPLIVGKFLYYILNSENVRDQIDNESFGTSGQKSLSLKNIKELKLPIPNTESEQSNIAQILTNVDDLIESLDKLIEKKKNIKQAAMQELFAGKNRLPGFKGEWELKNLGSVCTLQSGRRPKGGVTEEGDIPSLGGENIILEGGIDVNSVKKVSYEFCNSMTSGILRDNDVLINKDGANTGKVGLYTSKLFKAACINEHLFIMRGNGDLANSFLYYFLCLKQTKSNIGKFISSSAQPGINSKFVNHIQICLPQREEQLAIAQILSDMDAEIEVLKQKRDKYKQMKIGIMQQLLTGRIRVRWKN